MSENWKGDMPSNVSTEPRSGLRQKTEESNFEYDLGEPYSLWRMPWRGLAGTYPQADDLEAFWENLAEGRHCIR